MNTFFMMITWGGSIIILGPASLAIAAILLIYGRTRDVLLILGGLSGAMVLTHILKIIIARPRPPIEEMLVSVPSDLSFPSAHTSQASSLALAIILVFTSDLPQKWRGVFIAMMVILALFVGISRVYLGVHYFSDVIAGALLGLLWTFSLHKVISKNFKET